MSEEMFPLLGAFDTIDAISWKNAGAVGSHSYTCGYCGCSVASNIGYAAAVVASRVNYSSAAYVLVCHRCEQPTYFSPKGLQVPPAISLKSFSHVPEDLHEIYRQAVKCYSQGCFDATVMVARRMLMVLAWRLGADEGKTFQQYVGYLVECGAIAAPMKGWVDQIRILGNAANHEIPNASEEDAQKILRFVELIFENIWEAVGDSGLPSPFSLRELPDAG